MSKGRVKLIKKGVKELLKSQEVGDMVEDRAKSFADGKWKTDKKMMSTRVIASVYSFDPDTVKEELDTHRLVGRLK